MNTLGELASRRNNNFNLIRMLAAAAVLISHSYPLALGPAGIEPLSEWIGLSLGEVAVITFFCVSGFFISMSRDRAQGSVDFFTARFLRIYPGLLVVVLVCAFLIGTAFTTLPVSEYLSRSDTYRYVTGDLSLFGMRFQLPGVFEDNPLPGINGSLWTLFYEALLYVMVGLLGAAAIFDSGRRRFFWFLMTYGVLYIAYKTAAAHIPALAALGRLHAFFSTSLPFVIGMGLYHYRAAIRLRALWLVPLIALAAWSYKETYFVECLVAAWVYLIFYLGFAGIPWLERYNQLGDYSYGVYIYAFPVQEVLAHVQKGLSPLSMMVEALPIVLIAAVLSWHLVEKPSMSLRRSASELLTSYLTSLRLYWTKQNPPAL